MSFIAHVWAGESDVETGVEHVLPTGAMHVVLRFGAEPLTLIEHGRDVKVGSSVVGGARSSFYVRRIGGRSRSVGATLRAGAAEALFGAPASELAEQHTRLEDLWGDREVALLRERVEAASDPANVFRAALEARLDEATLPACVQHALVTTAPVADLVAVSGYSHRAFTKLFERAVGLTPKVHARIRRLQRALPLVRGDLADAAFAAGYADQPHLCRDFAALAGISPAAYRRLAPTASNHVPLRCANA